MAAMYPKSVVKETPDKEIVVEGTSFKRINHHKKNT